MQRFCQDRHPLTVGADGARYREQHNGKGDEDTEHHAEGIKELRI
jgi:hypothetical protein